MPGRRRIADKSAALAAIRELHQRGELNEHLQPVTRDPDSEEDEEEEEEKHAGTEKKSKYYLNEVQCMCMDMFGPMPSQNCKPLIHSSKHAVIALCMCSYHLCKLCGVFVQVPSPLQGCFPTNSSGNHLYILLMEEADTDIKKFPFSKQPPQGPHHAVGILTKKHLPHKQVIPHKFSCGSH